MYPSISAVFSTSVKEIDQNCPISEDTLQKIEAFFGEPEIEECTN